MDGAICCTGIFEFWSKIAHAVFQQAKKNRPRVPQGRPTSVKGGAPPSEVPKNRSQKQNASLRETITQMAPKLEPTAEMFVLFGGILFDALLASCV